MGLRCTVLIEVSVPGMSVVMPQATIALGQGAEAFLGTQGDPWDTQSDMGMAFLGAVLAMATLARVHDRHIATLATRTSTR